MAGLENQKTIVEKAGSAEQGGGPEAWPELPYAAWQDTYATLHRMVQIVGRIRGALSPQLNHYWSSTLYVTPRGLTTLAIPYAQGSFELRFDFFAHRLIIETSQGGTGGLGLGGRRVAGFYRELMAALEALGIRGPDGRPPQINLTPHPPLDPLPYDQDFMHSVYDPPYVERLQRLLVSVERVFQQFRARFNGKCSPVQLWPGSFDLAVTRFSGRRVAGSDDDAAFESSNAGFWPGSASFPEPAFYAYTTPAPEGIRQAAIQPQGAGFDAQLGEFILRYEQARLAAQPEQVILEFLQSTYESGAKLGGWHL